MQQDNWAQAEWLGLHDQHERYEGSAVLVKTAAVALLVLGRGLGASWGLLGVAMLMLWLSEAIFRTSQARLGVRLLKLEHLMEQGQGQGALRLYSDWAATRPGALGLLAEYGRHALRPTVAVVYVLLLCICTLQWWRY